jgi:hypothetical protein
MKEFIAPMSYLKKYPPIEMDEKLKARILGEAKFIRAWNFYQLVTMFGGVPLADHVLAPSEYNMPRATADQVWDLIEADLTSASLVLWKRSEYPAADLGRITKGRRTILISESLFVAREMGARQKLLLKKSSIQANTNSSQIMPISFHCMEKIMRNQFLKFNT